MPLVPTFLSCYANYIINGIILFIMWKQLQNGMISIFWWCDAFGTSEDHITLMALSMAPFCLLGQGDLNKVQYDFFGHVILVLASHATDGSSIKPFNLLVQGDQNKMQH